MRVLVVDDERLLLAKMKNLLGEVLAPADEIAAFGNAEETLAWVKENSPDVVFLDIELRGTMNGVELAQRIQELHHQTNIIFCTGYANYALDAIRVRCSGFLLKPITREGIVKAMGDLRYPLQAPQKRVKVRCLGNFDVLVDGVPVKFKYEKTKELLAVLVDGNGERFSNAMLESIIWEETGHMNYLKSLRRDLSQTLAELGCEDIIRNQSGKLAIVPEMLDCDYYELVAGRLKTHVHLNEYMSQYSWADLSGKAQLV